MGAYHETIRENKNRDDIMQELEKAWDRIEYLEQAHPDALGAPEEGSVKELKQIPEPCPKCGGKLVKGYVYPYDEQLNPRALCKECFSVWDLEGGSIKEPESTPEPCPKCKGELVERPDSYHWRGQLFPGAYCKKCNSLWPVGPGYQDFMKAVNPPCKHEPVTTVSWPDPETREEVSWCKLCGEKLTASYKTKDNESGLITFEDAPDQLQKLEQKVERLEYALLATQTEAFNTKVVWTRLDVIARMLGLSKEEIDERVLSAKVELDRKP